MWSPRPRGTPSEGTGSKRTHRGPLQPGTQKRYPPPCACLGRSLGTPVCPLLHTELARAMQGPFVQLVAKSPTSRAVPPLPSSEPPPQPALNILQTLIPQSPYWEANSFSQKGANKPSFCPPQSLLLWTPSLLTGASRHLP